MTKIVGIRFRNVGKIYYFDPKNYKMQIGDHVIVEAARGIEFGRVVLGPKEVGEKEVVHPLKEVLRVATEADEEREKQNRLKEKDAFKICQKKIREHGLEMKLIDADALIKIFDLGSKNGYVFVNFKDIVEIIKKQPEAYKADVVATELEQLKLDGACNNEDCRHCKYFTECWDGEMSSYLALDKAIEIVKRSGLDES